MENDFQQIHSLASDSFSSIDASTANVWMKRKRKKKKYKRSISSLKSMRKESTPPSCHKILSAPELTQRNGTPVPKKLPVIHSNPMFSPSTCYSIPESTIFNRTRNFDSAVSGTALNDTFEDQLQNSQMSLKSQLSLEWHKTPRNCKKELHSQSSLSEVTLNRALESPLHESSFEFSPTDNDTPLDECYFELSYTDDEDLAYGSALESDEAAKRSGLDDALSMVREQLKAQTKSQSSLNQRNNDISMQLQNFECYLRGKMDMAELYVKNKLSRIEESNLAVAKALHDMKGVERDAPIRINDIECRRTELVMPKIPVFRDVSLVLLNSALKNVQYMEQFVSEISHAVTLYAYNPAKSIKSIMTKLFTLNVLIKYTWSVNGERTKPAFSSHTNVLRAIARLLTNSMCERDMRRELREFFKQLPAIYERQKNRGF